MSTINTVATFKSALRGVIKSARSQRDKVQELLRFAIAHSIEHGDFTYLNMLVNQTASVRYMSTSRLKGFISEHVGNVKWTKLGDDKRGYAKAKKGEAVTCESIDNLPNWYDWEPEGGGGNNNTWTIEAALARLAKTAKKKGAAGSARDFARQIDAIMADTEFAAIFADADVEVETAERKDA